MLSVVPSAQAVEVPFFSPTSHLEQRRRSFSLFGADVDGDGDLDNALASEWRDRPIFKVIAIG
jgi:hypothetical protein